MHFFTVQRSDAVLLDVWFTLFQKTDYVVIIFLKWIKVKSKLADKISRINNLSSQLLYKIQHRMTNKFLDHSLSEERKKPRGGGDFFKTQIKS